MTMANCHVETHKLSIVLVLSLQNGCRLNISMTLALVHAEIIFQKVSLNFFFACDTADIKPWKVLTPFKVLILPGKNKITNTIFEPNLKHALLNTGYDDGHQPNPFPGFPEKGC